MHEIVDEEFAFVFGELLPITPAFRTQAAELIFRELHSVFAPRGCIRGQCH